MTLIVCVDKNGGILFNHRRVSSDRAVILDMLECVCDSAIYMREYSRTIFPAEANICVTDDYLNAAGVCDALFLEESLHDGLLNRFDKVIVYHWNRRYPSDVKFPLEQLRKMATLESTADFRGNSHECVTREVYVL